MPRQPAEKKFDGRNVGTRQKIARPKVSRYRAISDWLSFFESPNCATCDMNRPFTGKDQEAVVSISLQGAKRWIDEPIEPFGEPIERIRWRELVLLGE
jgi:hypothetical protein